MKLNIYLKSFIKGIFLSLAVVAVHLFCMLFFYGDFNIAMSEAATAIVFAALLTCFLKSKNIICLLITGFVGLFFMFFVEIAMMITDISVFWDFDLGVTWMDAYVAAFFGSMAGLVIAVVLTAKKISFFPTEYGSGREYTFSFDKEEIVLEASLKKRLAIYGALSAVTFSYLVLPEAAGISVPLFFIIQAVCLWFVLPDKKRLLFFSPALILSFNYFISGNPIWRVPNFFVCVVIYALVFYDFKLKDTSHRFLPAIIVNIIRPFFSLHIPFKWAASLKNDKHKLIKRICTALLITLPCMIILILLLSNADMIFSRGVEELIQKLFEFISVNTILKILFGILAGLYLFGAVYSSYGKKREAVERKKVRGDLIIINIFLLFVLAVYMVFVIIQFKYLFAADGMLPYGFTYTEYARKGFFELLALSGINILIILIIVRLTEAVSGRWKNLSTLMCCCLCAVTLVLLASSFYRMWLYSNDDGLTRLRFMVFGFLIFEAVGLLITFKYIIKPKFNITAVYLSIAMFYYMLLNIVPMDCFIAQNQINKYMKGERSDLEYVFTLSSDAAGPISRLDDIGTRQGQDAYFRAVVSKDEKLYPRWQRYNLSFDNALKLAEKQF